MSECGCWGSEYCKECQPVMWAEWIGKPTGVERYECQSCNQKDARIKQLEEALGKISNMVATKRVYFNAFIAVTIDEFIEQALGEDK